MNICGLPPFRDEAAKGWGTQVLFALESKILSSPSEWLCGVAADPLQNGTHRNACGTFRNCRLDLVVPCASGDVEMHPGSVFDKLFEEEGCGNRSAPAGSTCVPDVGDLAVDLVAVIVGAGKPPELFAGDLHRVLKFFAGLVVV